MRLAFENLRLAVRATHCGSALLCAAHANAEMPIDFAREVRPILADNCFHCHGPDEAQRQADLRLDVWDDADE